LGGIGQRSAGSGLFSHDDKAESSAKLLSMRPNLPSLLLMALPLAVLAQVQPTTQPYPATQPDISDPQSHIAALEVENQHLRQQLDDALAQVKDLKKQLAEAAANANRDDIFVGESEADMIVFIKGHGGGIAVLSDTATFKRCRVTFIEGVEYNKITRQGNEISPAVFVHKIVTIEGGKISSILPAAD